MAFILRPHQAHDFELLREKVAEHRAVLLVAPCGYGKGVVTTKIIDGTMKKGKHVLFLVHGRDRVADMEDRVTKLGIPHGILMGSRRRERHHLVQIASSDTVYRMPHKPKADLIIIDETHLAMSPTFRAVLDFYPDAKIIGLTATPVLGNGKGLGKASGGIYDSMIVGPSVKDLVSEGYLVGSRVMAPPPPAELKNLKKKKTGDFDGEQGAAICDNRKVIGDIIEHWKLYSRDRKTAVFAFNQKYAYHIAEQFREQGINWAYVDADTPDGDIHTPGTRKFIWHQYDHGDLVGVSSVGCISIGWDHSICKSLIFAAKTTSFPLYHQRLGRGSRPHKGYSDFLVLDHTGNLYEHEEQGPYFESDIKWQLNGDGVKKHDEDDPAPRVSTCKRPQPIPDGGVPSWFKGQTTNGYMLCCYLTFKAGPRECPRCGLPIAVDQPDIKVEDGHLEEITEGMKQEAEEKRARIAEHKQKYLEMYLEGVQKKYKSGWASIRYKAEFGQWPARQWKAEALEMVTE